MSVLHSFAIHTLGCKVNTYESQAIITELISYGLNQVDFDQVADVYIINTCSVTNTADLKSRNMIRRANKLNDKAIIIVAGCYSQTASEEIKKQLKADIIIGNKYKNNVYQLITEFQTNHKQIIKIENLMLEKNFEIITSSSFENYTRAFIKIQDGCNFMCSYCSIPFTRGKQRSAKLNDIIMQIKHYIKNGFKEIVLTGVNTSGYQDDTNDFYQLLLAVKQITGNFRVRISSVEPFQISDEIINVIMTNPQRFCQHWHLCLQSGSDEVLTAMHRKYTTKEFNILVNKIRAYNPLVAISTDYIVGFPTETATNHAASIEFLNQINFSFMHIFTYSKRKNTAANLLVDLHGIIKKNRFTEIDNVAKNNQTKFLKQFINKQVIVLFEHYANGVYGGKTSEYCEVLYKSNDLNLSGTFKTLTVVKILNDKLICQ